MTEHQRTIDNFHRVYYDSQVWMNTNWLGVAVQKCPLDLWIYQELLAERRPDVIIECGTWHGGSALFFASMCDLIGRGRVITVDIAERHGGLVHPRIEFRCGNSIDEGTVAAIRESIRPHESVMVVLDSDHTMSHVLREMELFGVLVTPGQYMIVEDTNINGHPVAAAFGLGPKEAVEQFLALHPEFTIDRSREKFFITFNPDGFLLKQETGE